MPDINFAHIALKTGEHLQEFMIPIAIGLAVITWRLVRWFGLGFINDVNTLKKEQGTYATKEALTQCHEKVAVKIDDHFETLDSNINEVHQRVDDLYKILLEKVE